MRRVLVAVAEPHVRDAYRGLFSDRGCEIEFAQDGVDCMARLRRSSPDLLVLDSQIHWGGGDGVVAAMHDDRRFHRIPILLTFELTAPGSSAREASAPPVVEALITLFPLRLVSHRLHWTVSKETGGHRMGPAELVGMPPEHDDHERSALPEAQTGIGEFLDDLRLLGQIKHALHATGMLTLRGVDVRVAGGTATLEGQVPSFYMKQLAQTATLAVPRIKNLRNHLRVGRPVLAGTLGLQSAANHGESRP
jgi:CheY-like chemotaxis protein